MAMDRCSDTAFSRVILCLAALLVTVSLLASGCGRKTPTKASVAHIDACTVLTAADVEKVLGVKMDDPQKRNQGKGEYWVSMCNYQGNAGNKIRSAGILLKQHHDAEGAEKAYAEYEAALVAELGSEVTLEPVQGIGQRAGWQDFGTSIAQLAVFQGPYQFVVTASATAKADQVTNAKMLSQRVLDHLQSR